jgi:diaminopimelate epimerase
VEHRVTAVTARVGTATFLPREIPLRFETPLIDDPVSLKGAALRMTAVGFGAPYAVVFVDTVGECRRLPLSEALSQLHIFPKGAEVVFAHVQGVRKIHLQVLHRDGGRRVVGRDICAALAAAVAVGRCAPDRTVTVSAEEAEFRCVCTKNRTLFLTCPVQVLSS